MKYKYAINYCSDCGMLTKWQRQCPNGKWYCMKCKAETEQVRNPDRVEGD